MAENRSALHGLLPKFRSGKEIAGVIFHEISHLTLIQITGWPDTLIEAGGETARFAGSEKAPGPGKAVEGSSCALLRVEPLKWWLTGEADIEVPDLGPSVGAKLDLSHSRTLLRVSGSRAALLLNHFLPVDLSNAAFPEGSVASTAVHHVGITLWRNGKGFNLFLPRSFAASLLEIMSESATQYGLEVA